MVSEARRRANDKYTAKCDRIMIKPLRPDGALIRQAARDAGQSLQGYIIQAVRDRMARDGAIGDDGGDGGSQAGGD